ncbi:hypothetical protein OJ405_002378 [Salmonella enterica]|nr:hypothetical protein [Salmonella enterica]ELS1746263.1 hypothetical protein [Salmonella enterica]ELW3720646.1 hypothetical protein [Salmonella enterica]EMB7326662.1 hypothetical protein [Salmonella enterica]
MKVKELIAMLNEVDPEAIVLISGYETAGGTEVAEVDLLVEMQSICLDKADNLTGNRRVVSSGGEDSVWLGWKDDYRTKMFLEDAQIPDKTNDGQ